MDLQKELDQKAGSRKDALGKDLRVIDDQALLTLAKHLDLHPREVYIESMRLGIVPLRYVRNGPSITLDNQITLARSRVAVVGAGGLGGHAICHLARLGVGEILMFDPDNFDETNLNRQMFSDQTTLNMPKVQVAHEHCKHINPSVTTYAHAVSITHQDQYPLFTGSHVIVDALDSARDRLILTAIARMLHVPLIHGAVAGFEGRLMTVYPGDQGIDILYDNSDTKDPSIVSAESLLGTPALSPSIIAAFQVMSALNILLDRCAHTHNRMTHLDLGHMTIDSFSL